MKTLEGEQWKRFHWSKKIVLNRNMAPKMKELSFEECMRVEMSPVQNEVFLIIDEWWKKYGFGPSIRDICNVRGKAGMGNTAEIINRLIKLGVLKKVKGAGRSVRPVYVNFRNLE